MADYEKIAMAAMEELDGHMCWPVEWFKEDLPVETKDGSAMDVVVEKIINKSNKIPKLMDPYVKGQEPLEIPKPDTPAKLNILAFADHSGYCKNFFANAPEGRISTKKVVENYHSLTQEDVKKLVNEPKKGWDMVVFTVGCDPPRSNSVPDVIEQSLGPIWNTVISRLYFWLSYELQRAETQTKIFCLVRGLFHEDKKTHMKAGLGLCVSGTLFGMCNTLRQDGGDPLILSGILLSGRRGAWHLLQELEYCDIHFCDTEYFLPDDSDVWARALLVVLVCLIILDVFCCGWAEAAGGSAAGAGAVAVAVAVVVVVVVFVFVAVPACIVPALRFHQSGNGALGLVMGNWLLDKAAEQGVGGFEIKFLSRSMKISDLNIPLWKDIEAKAAKLGITVGQGRPILCKMDMSSQEGCNSFIASCNGMLKGFIHSAGVLQDSMLMNLTWEKFETVYQSKHHAALFLHQAMELNPQKDLRFLWNFSSTSVYGNMGQLNYSGSNSFLDVLTRHRKAKGRPSTAIQWGAWGDVGMAATMTERGAGTTGLECGLQTGLAYFSVFKFNPQVMMGSVQAPEPTQACHHRNHYCEVCPTPMAPALERKHYYTIFRMAKGQQTQSPSAVGLVYNAYVKAAAAKHEAEWGDDFRKW
eukprot:s3175_g5.t1